MNFNWLTKIFRSPEDPSVPLNKAIELFYTSSSSASGITVNAKTALGNPAVWRATNLLASSVAKLPVIVFRKGPNDSRVPDERHPGYWLLRYTPNEFNTPYTWKHTLMTQVLLFGNSYCWVERDELARPVALRFLDPESTWPVREDGRISYFTRVEERSYKLSFSEVAHFKGLSPDGLVGYSITDVLKDALGLGLGLQRFGSVFFKNGARPGAILELPAGLRDPVKLEEFKRSWNNAQQGVDRAFSTAVVPSGCKVTTQSVSNEDGQFTESREFDLVSVANCLGIPPSFLGSAVNTSYSSLESDAKSFLANSLDGWLTMIEEELSQKLLSERQKFLATHFIEFNRKGLIQTDTQTETNLLIQQYQAGLLSWEECRQIMNRATEKDEKQTWQHPSNIMVEGEELPAPEPPQPQEQAPEPQESEEKQRLRLLAQATVKRLINRLERGGDDLSKHRPVILENLGMFPRVEAWADNLLASLNEELAHTLPEQREAVFSRLDTKQLVEELWSEDTAQ